MHPQILCKGGMLVLLEKNTYVPVYLSNRMLLKIFVICRKFKVTQKSLKEFLTAHFWVKESVVSP